VEISWQMKELESKEQRIDSRMKEQELKDRKLEGRPNGYI